MTVPRFVLYTLALPASFTACAQGGAAPVGPVPGGADTVVVVDTVVTDAGPNEGREARVARLEIMLLERDARIRRLQESLDATRQEVVRNLAKLQSQASRAESASGIAEAEIAVQTLARTPGGPALDEHAEAAARLEESSSEFARENFGGALYLATQARTLAADGRARLSNQGRGDLRPDESVFATAVPLQTVEQRVNVRSGPGLSHDVLTTLEPGTALVGQSYTSEWVRVIDDDGGEGWIFHTLVTARER